MKQPSQPVQPSTPTVQRSKQSDSYSKADSQDIVQRKSPPPAEPAAFPPETYSEDAPSLAENQVDLFTAMMDAGAITSTPASSSAPQISRRAEPESSHHTPQPPANPPTDLGGGLEQYVADEGSPDSDLLSLLDLPSTTPIVRQTQSEPKVARSAQPETQQRGNQPPPTAADHAGHH
jgi:hypothetical protein